MTGNKTPSYAALQNAKSPAEAYQVACSAAVTYLQMLADNRYDEFYASAFHHKECTKQIRNLVTQYRELCALGDPAVMLATWNNSFREVGGPQMPTVTVLRKITRLCNYLRMLDKKEALIMSESDVANSKQTPTHSTSKDVLEAVHKHLVTIANHPNVFLRACYVLSLARKVLMMITYTDYSVVLHVWGKGAFGPKPRCKIAPMHTDLAAKLSALTQCLPSNVVTAIMFPGNEIPLINGKRLLMEGAATALDALALHQRTTADLDPAVVCKLVRPEIYNILSFGGYQGAGVIVPGKNALSIATMNELLGAVGPGVPDPEPEQWRTQDGGFKSQADLQRQQADRTLGYHSGYNKGWEDGHKKGDEEGYERGTKEMEALHAQPVEHTPPTFPPSLAEVQRIRRQLVHEAKANHAKPDACGDSGVTYEQMEQAAAYLTHLYGRKVGLDVYRKLPQTQLAKYAAKQVNCLLSGITPVPIQKDRNIAYHYTMSSKEPEFGIDLDTGDMVKVHPTQEDWDLATEYCKGIPSSGGHQPLNDAAVIYFAERQRQRLKVVANIHSDAEKLRISAGECARAINNASCTPGIVDKWREIAAAQAEAQRQAMLAHHEQTRQLELTEYPWYIWASLMAGCTMTLVGLDVSVFAIALVSYSTLILTLASAGYNKAGKR